MGKNIFSFSEKNINEHILGSVLQNVMEAVAKENISHVATNTIRSIMSEILSNIVSHAYFNDNLNSVSLSLDINDDNTAQIKTRNLIKNEKIGGFTLWLNKMNLKSKQELRALQQETLQQNLNTPGSAGIGLIMVRRKVNKPIVCTFEPVDDNISYLDMELEVSLNVVEEWQKEETKRTPRINFDMENQMFEFSGVSYPEDAETYYTEIESWIENNEQYIAELQNPVLKIDLDYFNSISLKNIIRMVRDLISTNPDKFTVNWYYDADDEISHEEGVEMSEILQKKFNFIQKN